MGCMTIGERIKAARKAVKMTQAQLAESSNISLSSIRRYESGTSNPTLDILIRMADGLDVRIGELALREAVAHIDKAELLGRAKVEIDSILRRAVKAYGANAQTDMCIEEMSELTKALLKMRRAGYPKTGEYNHELHKAIIEEIADVQIMLEQMKIIYGDSAGAELAKIDRLKYRLDRRKAAAQEAT